MDQTIYNIALVAHISGVVIMAGTTFIDFVNFRQFWKVFHEDKAKALVLEDNLYKMQRYMGIGMLLIIISGVGMMAYLHQVWGQQLWFRVKMGILILIIINGLGFRRMLGAKLRKLLTVGSFEEELVRIKSKLTLVHLLQLLLFLIIFVLSVFKFN